MSVLICTLDERAAEFETLYNSLKKQIKDAGLENEVEILFFKDNREHSVGYKRNTLLQQSCGKYICFVDDDDRVHEQYIQLLYDAVKNDPDCVSLKGIMTHKGEYPRTFIHSIKYSVYSNDETTYYRPPNHLNTMRRSIAIQFLFPEKDHGEDYQWAMKVAHSGLLKREVEINEPCYFYQVSNDPRRKYW